MTAAGAVSSLIEVLGRVRAEGPDAVTVEQAGSAVVAALRELGARSFDLDRESIVDDYVAMADGMEWTAGGRLPGGARFLIRGQSTVDYHSLLAIAASARVALLRATLATDAERAAALTEALACAERAVTGRALALEETVRAQRADSRVVENLRVVGAQLTAQLDLDVLVQDATDAATAATGAQFGAFFYNLVNEYGESYTLYTLSGVPRATFDGFPMPRNTAVFAPTFNGVGTVRSADITADARYGHNGPHHGMPPGHLPVRSYLAVPVVSPTSREVLGGFFFGHSEVDRFAAGHERLAEGIAGYTAIGLDNARLYARQRTLATELARSMLPIIGDVPGFTTVARYLPAATGSEVGGDWLDVIDLPCGRTAFVVGDVMGRGVPAASTMGQMRTAVRAYAMLELSAAEVLRRASQLAMTMPGQQFITCVYAVHDPVEGTLTYANAGHPPPAVIRPDGSVFFARDRLGMPLRVGESFEERVLPFPGGSALVLYTDGLVERRGRPLPAGIDQLEDALRRLVAPVVNEPSTACDKLIGELTDGAHDDDVALLYACDSGQSRRVAVLPLTADAEAGARSRRFAAETLAGWGLIDPKNNVAIVATELVSNAVRHSLAPVALRLHHIADSIVVEVLDEDDRPPRPGRPGAHEENHRGLLIVETLSLRWGSRPMHPGKVVWAELAV